MKRICLIFFVILGLIGNSLHAQDRRVTGTVTDLSSGQTLPGVTVMVKGTNIGTVTDPNGNYELSVPSDAVLVFSFIGMNTEEVAIGERSIIDLAMAPDVAILQEIVVTAVGIERTAKSLGYAVSSVDAATTQQRSEPDVLRTLQGKIPGVDISGSSGAAGSATRITIRGASSFFGNNQPLIIVDGIPYSNEEFATSDRNSSGGAYGSGLATLDPNNIRSMNVLKGAAAAALYGSRASNGVIVIETLTGNAQRTRQGLEVTLGVSNSWETVSNLPNYQNSYGAGVDFAYAAANGSWGPHFDDLDSIPLWGEYASAFPDMPRRVPYQAYPDNVANLFQTGTMQEYTLNVAGGTDRTNIAVSASAADQTGYIPNSSFERYNIGIGGNSRLENGIRVNGSFNYTTSKQVGGFFGNNQAAASETASSFARSLFLARNWDMDLPYTNPVTGGTVFHIGVGQADNPLWSWENNTITTNVDRVVANASLEYDIFSWLNVTYQLGTNTYSQRRTEVHNLGSRAWGGAGAITEDDIWLQELESNLLFTFTRALSQDFSLKAIAGNSFNQRTRERQAVRGLNMIAPGIYHVGNTTDVIPFVGENQFYQRRRLNAVFADVALGYRDYLFLNLTGRNDWSSTLPADNRSYFYPAAALSFVFSEALDLESDLFNTGRVRASWARIGADAPIYSIFDSYNIRSAYFPFGGTPGMVTPTTGYDENLTPEFTTEIELGAQFEFFQNRLGIDFAWYDKRSTNQIAAVSVPATTGYTSLVTNFGELQNTGIELGVNLVPVRLPNTLEWSIFTSFTRNRSEVLSLVGDEERIVLAGLFGDPSPVLEVGQPYGVLRGSVSPRDSEGNLLINPGTGTMLNTVEDKTIGDPNPDFILGVNNTLSYRGFSLNFLVDYKHGGDLYSVTVNSMLGRGVTKDTEDRERTFIIPGVYGDPVTGEAILDADGNKIPNTTQLNMNDLVFGNTFAINADSEWSVYDASVFRLREVSLGYTLRGDQLGNLPLGSLTISLSGRNLWFYALNMPEHTNFDPEIGTYGASNVQGIEYSGAPSVRRFGVNLRATF